MQRGSDKHGPNRDDALKHDTEGLDRAGRESHVEEWREQEPPGEDEPTADRSPEAEQVGGTPVGMTAADVAGRAELARHLTPVAFPAGRAELIAHAAERRAPDKVLDVLRELPADREFRNVQEVWVALGGGVERSDRRS